MTTAPDNIQTAIEAGKQIGARTQDILGIPCAVTPSQVIPLTAVLELSDLRDDKPRRRRGTAEMQSIDSFGEHVNRFKSPASAVWADAASKKFLAVLNYHPEGATSAPAWGDHRATYPCPLSPEWTVWGAGAQLSLEQDDFAAFLEDHDRDLATAADADGNAYPTPSALMTLAATLETYSKSEKKRERVGSNIALVFKEDSGVKGNVTIPRSFCVKIPVFADSEPQVIEVRLRLDVENGEPTFSFQIHDSTKVLRLAFEQLVVRVREATQLPVFIGTPEK